ncbi:MAG: DUF917 domain-containing protein [Chloroflexota bacterium]|nr:DUF917 domain-containing protein [Chloroflexota bacterium]
MAIAFQNENLIAWEGPERQRVVATVSDLITLVNEESGDPVTTEITRYGLRVAVLGIPAAVQLKTRDASPVVGPEAFGYDVAFAPLPGTYGGHVLSAMEGILRFFYACTQRFLQRYARLASQPFWRTEGRQCIRFVAN